MKSAIQPIPFGPAGRVANELEIDDSWPGNTRNGLRLNYRYLYNAHDGEDAVAAVYDKDGFLVTPAVPAKPDTITVLDDGKCVTLDRAYDSVVERLIGLEQRADPATLTTAAAKAAAGFSVGDNTTTFRVILQAELDLQRTLKADAASASLGFNNLLAQLADDSESRVYRLRRRLA